MRRIILFCIMSVGLILSLSIALAQDKVVVIPLFDDCTGNATSADVLSGKTFSNASGKGLTGTRPPAPVEKTGQTNCYDTSGTAIDCSGTGQDGEHQKGITWPSPRFTDNEDGTVTDNLTGLIWLKNAYVPATTRTWANALADVAELNADGTMNSNSAGDTSNGGSHQTDWRLPNIKELLSLIDFGNSDLLLPSGHPFTNVQSYYWSGSTDPNNTNRAWDVDMGSGETEGYDKSGGNYDCVWPVRGGN